MVHPHPFIQKSVVFSFRPTFQNLYPFLDQNALKAYSLVLHISISSSSYEGVPPITSLILDKDNGKGSYSTIAHVVPIFL